MINSSGVGTAGRVTLFDLDGTFVVDSHVTILRLNFDKVNADFVLYCLASIGFKNLEALAMGQSGQIELTIPTIQNIKIPLPPKNIQDKIVAEIELLENGRHKVDNSIEFLKNSISNLMNFENVKNQEKLEKLAGMIRRGKSTKYGKSEIQIIKSGQARGVEEFDFAQKHYVAEGFVLDERKLERGDILINSSGVGTAGRVTLFDLEGVFVVDSHITILRCNLQYALPKFILQSLIKLGFKNIEAMALGQSGQIELSITTIQNIKISVPTIEEQQTIVNQIEIIESKIAKLEQELSEIPVLKEAVLKKYL